MVIQTNIFLKVILKANDNKMETGRPELQMKMLSFLSAAPGGRFMFCYHLGGKIPGTRQEFVIK